MRCGINSHVTSDFRRHLRMIVSHGAPQKRNFMLRNVLQSPGVSEKFERHNEMLYYVRLLGSCSLSDN
ncbi:MAG: hypothetical protein ACTS6P_00820 [Candidatus Hodgkinia cicadicola]